MREYYEIFRVCFPYFSFGQEDFAELSEIGSSTVFSCKCGEKTVGFASVNANKLRLLCVLPEYRKQGFGSRLLNQAENYVREQGFSEFIAGGTDSRLFIGAAEESADFFEKRGFSLGGIIAEMCGDTDKLTSAPVPENVSFGFYSGDRERLNEAVSAVEDDWVQYFAEGEIFCAFKDGSIASFCIVVDDEQCLLTDGKNKIGSIGCVGTVPEFRRKGIGLKMVSLSAEELKKRGCKKIFIHYTHVYDWYAKLGFETFLRVRLGKKMLE